jgi:endonuclease-3
MRSAPDSLRLLQILDERYGTVAPFLQHDTLFHFLVAVILSAQTTDALVNTVTPALFARYPDPESLAHADVVEVEVLVKRVNYYKTKAKNLVGMAQLLIANFDGEVPSTLDGLVTLPGVGRKVANVIISDHFGIGEGIVVDTHVGRVSYRVGWTDSKDPKKIEQDLMQQWPNEYWVESPKRLILIGRQFCFAHKKPDCDHCPLRSLCEKRVVTR